MGSIYNLLYYALRPGASLAQLDLYWDAFVAQLIGKLVLGSDGDRGLETGIQTAEGINHHRSLAGPDGQRHETDVPRHIGIWKFSKNIEPGKEWIRYLLGRREVYDEYIMSGDAFNLPAYASLVDHPVLKTDPKFAALRQEGVQFHCYGWPAPPSDKIQLTMRGSSLDTTIATADSRVAQLLNAKSDELSKALRKDGIELRELRVRGATDTNTVTAAAASQQSQSSGDASNQSRFDRGQARL